jgi:Lar family restriction alleviation protein
MMPCPFCGSTVTVALSSKFDAGTVAHIHCQSCGADGPECYSEVSANVALHDAQDMWNRRRSYR